LQRLVLVAAHRLEALGGVGDFVRLPFFASGYGLLASCSSAGSAALGAATQSSFAFDLLVLPGSRHACSEAPNLRPAANRLWPNHRCLV